MGGRILLSCLKYELREMTPRNPDIMAGDGAYVAIQAQYLAVPATLAVCEGMAEEQALEAITTNEAKVIGVDYCVGRLETGKDADIVLLGRHPFDYRIVGELVLVDRQVVYLREGGGP